jgi:hypothetical protein
VAFILVGLSWKPYMSYASRILARSWYEVGTSWYEVGTKLAGTKLVPNYEHDSKLVRSLYEVGTKLVDRRICLLVEEGHVFFLLVGQCNM